MADRAVSVTVSYVITLAITAVLISGLILAAGSLVDGMKGQTSRDGYEVVGNRMVSGLQTADRMAQTGGSTVEVSVDLPGLVAGTQYNVVVNNSSNPPTVRIQSSDARADVVLPVANETALRSGEVPGGPVQVVLEDGKLEVQSNR